MGPWCLSQLVLHSVGLPLPPGAISYQRPRAALPHQPCLEAALVHFDKFNNFECQEGGPPRKYPECVTKFLTLFTITLKLCRVSL